MNESLQPRISRRGSEGKSILHRRVLPFRLLLRTGQRFKTLQISCKSLAYSTSQRFVAIGFFPPDSIDAQPGLL